MANATAPNAASKCICSTSPVSSGARSAISNGTYSALGNRDGMDMETITSHDKEILVNAAYILRHIGENDLGDDVSNIANKVEVRD